MKGLRVHQVGAVVGAALAEDWNEVHEACLRILDAADAGAVIDRIGSSLSVEEARTFTVVARDAAGRVSTKTAGVATSTQMFGMSYVCRDGVPLSRAEILTLERSLDQIAEVDGEIFLHHETFAPFDIDGLSPTSLRELSRSLHRAWDDASSLDAASTPRSTFGRGAGMPGSDQMEVGFLVGVREVPVSVIQMDDVGQTEEGPGDDVEKSFKDLIGERISRLVAVDFPSPIGQALPNAVLRSTVSGMCHEVYVAACGIEGDMTMNVEGEAGVVVRIQRPDGSIPFQMAKNVDATCLDASDVADILRNALAEMLRAYGQCVVPDHILPN